MKKHQIQVGAVALMVLLVTGISDSFGASGSPADCAARPTEDSKKADQGRVAFTSKYFGRQGIVAVGYSRCKLSSGEVGVKDGTPCISISVYGEKEYLAFANRCPGQHYFLFDGVAVVAKQASQPAGDWQDDGSDGGTSKGAQ